MELELVHIQEFLYIRVTVNRRAIMTHLKAEFCFTLKIVTLHLHLFYSFFDARYCQADDDMLDCS